MVDDQVGTGDIEGAGLDEIFGAVAEVGHLEMRVAGELEVELGGLVALGGAGEDPSAAGEQGPGEVVDEPLGLVRAEGGELETPAVWLCLCVGTLRACSDLFVVGHTEMIGWEGGGG